ncbi:hypothetical protein IE81DRAFT_250205 [Ceraceosorus guamensis]|uniref:Uncharacterized protein n=1 Tax=Ceraceosorus guamensis TaxID=1522189 RepID=A0A316VUG3_9BASI|nr:hypothetical protein IE81DRAFT_250205 [Ceraceosorus guamensis]PWN39901.1 hypothetical protein IE81DRAFT_250205 [Ceraceosorus guamensis]
METGNVKTLATQASAVLPATQVDESSEPPGPRPWNRLIPQLARVEPPAIRLPLDLPGSVKLEAVEIDVAPKAKRLIYHDWHPRRQILDFVDLGGDASLNEDDLRDLQSSIRSPPARASGPAVDEGHRAWATKAEIIEFRNAVAAGRNPDTASLNIRPHARNALNMTMGKATESGSETEESPSASIQPKPAAAAASVRQRRGPVLPAPPSGITSRQSRKRRWQAEEQDREEVARSPPTTNVSNSEHEKESQAAAKESSQSVIVIPSSDHDAAPGLSAVERPSTADVPARHAAEPSATAAMEHVTLRVPDAHPGAQPVIDQASGQASLADSKGRQRQRSATFELNAADGVPSHAHLSAAVTNGSTLLPEQPRETSAASHAPSISTSAPVNTTREGSVASLASSAPAPLLPLKRSAPSPLPSDAVFIEFSDSSEDEYDRDGRPVMPLAPQRLPSQSNGRLTQASRLSSSELHAKPLAVAGSKEAPFSLDDDASNSSSSTLLASPLHLFKRPRTSADQPSRTGQPTPRPHVSSFIGHSGTISDSALDAEKPASQPRPSAPPTGGRHALGQGRREPRQYMPNPIEVLQQAQRAKES